jgi:DNA-binding SARP family transcriptional activator
MRFTVLGPLKIVTDGGVATPTAPMLRRVLALLLLRANTVVRSGTLVEELWGDRPPRSARTTLQTYIYQLRKLLAPEAPQAAGLLTRPLGYELRLGPDDQLDARDFSTLLNRAKQMRADGLIEDAVAALRTALAQWHGPALADIETGSMLDPEVTRLEEMRREAHELRLELELRLGRHHELVSELTSLVSANPAHEGFVAKLMVALVGCGRRTEALEVYRRTRTELATGLGLEPSREIQQLHQAILSGDLDGAARLRTPSADPVAVPPAQLPAAVSDFVGRESELRRLRDAVVGDGRRSGPGLPIVQVLGAPGVGKSTFVIRAAHELRPQFPDGQFYAAVGDATEDAELADIVAGFLHGCGIPDEYLPQRLPELSGMFRTWTADRRALVVLDDVVSAAQLRALVPSGSGCAVLLTARTRLAALPGMLTIGLPALPDEASWELLGRIVGPEPPAAEPAAAQALVRLCGGLPAGLRAVGGRASARPHGGLGRLVERLSDPECLLDELGADGDDLRGAVALLCGQLPDEPSRAFRLLGRLGPRPVTAGDLTELMTLAPAAAENVLEDLADAFLIQELPATDGESTRQYRVPALIGAIARSLPGPDEAHGRRRPIAA